METMVDKQQLLNERITEVSFTTSLFKAYRQTYNQGEEIQISLPPSRQMVNVGDITLYFRPLVKYQQDGDLTKFQNAQRCLTAINAANHLTISSITLNNNEILCQPRQNNQFARTVLDQYMKSFLKTKPVKGLSSDGVQLTTNFMIQSSSAMNAYNVLENQICVPANGIFTHPSMQKTNEAPAENGAAGLFVKRAFQKRDRGQNSSNFEGSYKPRAIVSQLYNYYYNCNLPPDDKKTTFGCSYYEQYSGVNLGNPRREEVKADGSELANFGTTSVLPNNLDSATFPNLPRCITPSISLYKRQQESFMAYRQRFIQIHVTPYEDPSIPFKLGSKTLMSDQSQGYINIAASDANKGFSNLVSGPDGYSGYESVIGTRAIDADNATNLRAMPAKLVDCRFSYGIPVQQQGESAFSRYEGKIWSDSDTTLLNQERYTTVAVKLSEISPELEQIGLICLEKTRVDISLFVNLPACCLSSYVQPSLILDSLNSAYSTPSKYSATPGVTQGVGGSPQYYKKFIDLCQIGQGVSLTLNDLVMRIETHSYTQAAYQMVKEILYQPKPYTTFRMTTKQIQGDGPLSIPLNLGVSTTLRCLLYWIIPRSNRFTSVQTKRSLEIDNALPQDAMVEYSACQPPQRGDIRSTILDSYYIPHESFLTIDNEIYNKTQIPLQDPQLSQYLLSSGSLQTALSRYLDIDLQSFLHNRFIGVISVDPSGSRKFISQMLDFTINIDSKDRVNHAKTFNLHCRSINDQFDVVIAAVVGQSVVECQRVIT